MKQVILASRSPRRKTLLKQLGLKFIVSPSRMDEIFNPRLKPKGQVEALCNYAGLVLFEGPERGEHY